MNTTPIDIVIHADLSRSILALTGAGQAVSWAGAVPRVGPSPRVGPNQVGSKFRCRRTDDPVVRWTGSWSGADLRLAAPPPSAVPGCRDGGPGSCEVRAEDGPDPRHHPPDEPARSGPIDRAASRWSVDDAPDAIPARCVPEEPSCAASREGDLDPTAPWRARPAWCSHRSWRRSWHRSWPCRGRCTRGRRGADPCWCRWSPSGRCRWCGRA